MSSRKLKFYWKNAIKIIEKREGTICELSNELERKQETIDSAHDYIRSALGLSDDAPRRFDYYASLIESNSGLNGIHITR